MRTQVCMCTDDLYRPAWPPNTPLSPGYRHQHPPPLPPQVRPGFPPPLGRPPPPPPPPLTCAPPPPPPPRFHAPPPNQPPTPPLLPPETESSAQKKTDQPEDRQSDSSHDTLVKDGREVKRSGGGFAPLKQTLMTSMKGKDDTKSDTGSKVKISLGGGGFGSVGGSGLLGKRAAGNITMKLKPQVMFVVMSTNCHIK